VLLAAAAAVVIPSVGSELALGSMKLQTGLTRVLAVWIVSYAIALLLIRNGGASAIALTIFWSGAFLVWFGVRSHLESSILLRVLVLLKDGPKTDARLVQDYSARWGESMRVAELCRGGLAVRQSDGVRATRKGKTILLLASRLR
jgi:hypothetical protein